MKNSIVNGTLALTSASLLTIVLHELAHYITSTVLGYDPTLFHNQVKYGSVPNVNHEMAIAAAGPLFSLLQGVVAYAWAKSMRSSVVSLLILWLGINGILAFMGYMMIGPLLPFGDTGRVFALLEAPMLLPILCAIGSVIVLTVFLIKSTPLFEHYAIDDFGSIRANRAKWAYALVLIPLVLSIIVVTSLQFPVPHFISILPTICIPFSLMAIFGTFMGTKGEVRRDPHGRSINEKISTPLVVLFVVLVAINRLLVGGVG